MSQYIKYNKITGEIKALISCPSTMKDAQITVDEAAIEGTADDLTQYINPDTLEITDKSDLPAILDKTEIIANAQDQAIISGLPNPTVVTVDEIGAYEVTDGDFEFTVDTSGEYQIICKAFPYLDKEFTVNAS